LQLINLDFDLIVLSEIWSCNVSMHHTLFAGYTFYYDLPMSSSVGVLVAYLCQKHTKPWYTAWFKNC